MICIQMKKWWPREVWNLLQVPACKWCSWDSKLQVHCTVCPLSRNTSLPRFPEQETGLQELEEPVHGDSSWAAGAGFKLRSEWLQNSKTLSQRFSSVKHIQQRPGEPVKDVASQLLAAGTDSAGSGNGSRVCIYTLRDSGPRSENWLSPPETTAQQAQEEEGVT